jgi:DNA primase large subunit
LKVVVAGLWGVQQRHARYPFLTAAREAVREADIDLAELVAAGGPAVEHGLARVEHAIEDGTVGEPHRRPRTELLSYPVARGLVSLVDQPVLTRRYARAEARTAAERLRADAEGEALRSADRGELSLREFLAEFDLASGADEREQGYEMAVTAYLPLAASRSGDGWRLVNRDLADGRLPVSEAELFDLLETAVERRVEGGLPLDVPGTIAGELETGTARLEELLAGLDLTRDIDTVAPELFPPCMKALLDRVQKGEHLAHHSRFAITAFLTSIGMSTDDIVELYEVNPGFGEEMTRYQTNHIRGEVGPTEYSPPSCATMQSYGDCVNMDDLCETIAHPLAYYEEALERADEDVEDWRERADG